MRAWQIVLAAHLMGGAALAETPGDPVAGRLLAGAQCSSCHAIGSGHPAPPLPAASSFAEVARLPSTTALSLQVLLRTPHADMPDIVLTPAQMDDLIAYILSLRDG